MGIQGDLTGMQLAVTEAVTNAVRHAGCEYFEVSARLSGKSMFVADRGSGWEAKTGQSLGLGIAIIQELAQAVDFEHTDPPGTRVTMRFDRGDAYARL